MLVCMSKRVRFQLCFLNGQLKWNIGQQPLDESMVIFRKGTYAYSSRAVTTNVIKPTIGIFRYLYISNGWSIKKLVKRSDKVDPSSVTDYIIIKITELKVIIARYNLCNLCLHKTDSECWLDKVETIIWYNVRYHRLIDEHLEWCEKIRTVSDNN